MSLLPFLLVTGLGAIAALLLRGRDRLASGIGVVALMLAVVTALLIRPNQAIVIGSSGIATTDYVRIFLVIGSLVALLLAVVGEATTSRRDAPAAALGILATSALALSVPDARVAVLAATAGGAFGALVALAPIGGRLGATIGTRVLRATAVAGTMAIAATAWIGRDLSQLAAQPIVFGLAYLAFALAVAMRFGAIPLHAWAARLTDTVPETTLPLVTALAPATLAIVALAWADASVAPLLLDLGSVRAVVLGVAIASIILAAIAAFIQDDIEHIVGYAIVGDAGVVLLAIAALDPAAWAPARTWILAFVASRSAFAAWAAATRAWFGTGRVP
jgi:NADH:ubiquinone oxidoreductase subunit 2 (subunit N)